MVHARNDTRGAALRPLVEPGASLVVGDLADADQFTQVLLATSDDAEARATGGYWFHQRHCDPHPAVHDTPCQDRLVAALAQHTGAALRPITTKGDAEPEQDLRSSQ